MFSCFAQSAAVPVSVKRSRAPSFFFFVAEKTQDWERPWTMFFAALADWVLSRFAGIKGFDQFHKFETRHVVPADRLFAPYFFFFNLLFRRPSCLRQSSPRSAKRTMTLPHRRRTTSSGSCPLPRVSYGTYIYMYFAPHTSIGVPFKLLFLFGGWCCCLTVRIFSAAPESCREGRSAFFFVPLGPMAAASAFSIACRDSRSKPPPTAKTAGCFERITPALCVLL